MRKKLHIIMEGGLIQGILSDDPDWVNANLEIYAVDHDEGDTNRPLTFTGGEKVDVFVGEWTGDVQKTDITNL